MQKTSEDEAHSTDFAVKRFLQVSQDMMLQPLMVNKTSTTLVADVGSNVEMKPRHMLLERT